MLALNHIWTFCVGSLESTYLCVWGGGRSKLSDTRSNAFPKVLWCLCNRHLFLLLRRTDLSRLRLITHSGLKNFFPHVSLLGKLLKDKGEKFEKKKTCAGWPWLQPKALGKSKTCFSSTPCALKHASFQYFSREWKNLAFIDLSRLKIPHFFS